MPIGRLAFRVILWKHQVTAYAPESVSGIREVAWGRPGEAGEAHLVGEGYGQELAGAIGLLTEQPL